MRGARAAALAAAMAAALAAAARAEAPLDLARLFAVAEAGSPVVRAAEARLEAARRVAPQQEALPDPIAGITYTNDGLPDLTLGSSEFSNLTLSWQQEVPYPGKRGLARDVARHEVDALAFAADAARLEVRARVAAAYAEILRVDRGRAILDDSKKLLQSLRDTARARYESGDGTLESILRAESDLAALDAERIALDAGRREAEAGMIAALGTADAMTLGPALAEPSTRVPDAAAAERAAIERSPTLAGLRATVAREQSRLELAERNLNPDFSWNVAYAYRGGLDPMVTGGIGFRIPAWRKSKQKEAVAEARAGLDASRAEVEAGQVELVAEARRLVARVNRAVAERKLYDENILPNLQSTLDAALAAFVGGRVPFVTVIDDFRALLQARQRREESVAEAIRALAALGPLTGESYVDAAGAGGNGD